MSADLIELVQRLGRPRVLVVGDIMLDRYVWGNAERISQEAPVILLRADRREERLGGAGSVATMLQALDACVTLAGVVGSDADGERVSTCLESLGINPIGVLFDDQRPTTVKERYMGRAQQKHPQQMLRVDFESREPVPVPIENALCDLIDPILKGCDIVLVSDYDKGVCTPGLMRHVLHRCSELSIRVLVDPARGADYAKYIGCSAMTPNRLEAGLALGRTISNSEQAVDAAADLRDRLHLEAGIVTLDKDGMALAERGRSSRLFPTRPRQVYDITGAGDMVLSVLGIALAAGAEYDAAIRLANIAGGLEVEKVGVSPISREEILADLLKGPGAIKVCDLQTLLSEIKMQRQSGRSVAFTNGCFDVLHAGHVQYLDEARRQADCLVVGLNSDSSVRALKGPARPVNPVDARAFVLAAMQSVDYVVVFDEPTPTRLIEAIRPDVLVKGADYRRDQVVGGDFVESYGGRVHLAPLREGMSTTKLIGKLRVAS